MDAASDFKSVLSEFLDFFNPFSILKSAIHDAVYHLLNHSSSVKAKPRRFHPMLYGAVKAEFEFLLSEGIIRPSKNILSSPPHVVPKSDSIVRPVGYYRELNTVTEIHSYHRYYFQDFEHALHDEKTFSTVDIFKASRKIPITECDKTAVTA
ncbi:hypothetical protein AVEN_95505-1 [Araneus ventricosus]|uniref:Uncharacterized protein n=1 Tax=Araneus ventricosus TaxID=182803 RepID=A0A4Y2PCM8_ARAVE|nr:hypothetical protein AVEN_95505-1 [Araneus ventricosus]